MTDMKAALKSILADAVLTVSESNDTLSGTRESITSKWWLGGRKVTYRASCRLAEAERTVHFREVVVECSWGIPPPTLTVENPHLSFTEADFELHHCL
jgi:hypothetical protein